MDFLKNTSEEKVPLGGEWKIIVADDEEDVHKVTFLNLRNLVYDNKSVQLINASSAKETIALMARHPDVSVILLDMIMESENAGLEVIRYVREDLNNHQLQIILRTGQAGQFPAQEMVLRYAINDYKDKTELTKTKLVTSVVAALRSYQSSKALKELNESLENRVRQRTMELDQKNQELEKVLSIKNQFFKIIAHDLRNPVSVFSSVSYLLDQYLRIKAYDELEEVVKELQKSSQNISRLLDDLLLWSLSEEGSYPYHKESFSFKELALETIGLLQLHAGLKNIRLQLEEVEDIRVEMDKTSLSIVLRNLISNAIKFTGKGGDVRVAFGQSGGRLQVRIADTGIGIPPEGLGTIHQMLSRKGTMGEKGTGVGLKLVQDFLSMNRGEMQVESVQGRGTTFTLVFNT